MGFDIAPAQLQTYINPIGDLPFYWLTKYFPSWVAGFVLGAVHGFNLSLIFLIFGEIFEYPNPRFKFLLGVGLVIVSGIAPGFISELGNTMEDNLTSLFVLGAVYLLICALKEDRNEKKVMIQIGWAGFLMGFGVGVKPSITIFAVSSALALCLFRSSWKKKITGLIIYGIFGILGGLLSAGYWWWFLWMKFGNPFFPFYNHIFKSPYFTIKPVVWSTYLPVQWWEYILWPFIFSFNGLRVNPFQYSDIRFSLLYFIAIVWTIGLLIRKLIRRKQMPGSDQFDAKMGNFLLWFFLISYLLWIKESATYRFIIPLELLVPLCILVILDRLIGSRKIRWSLVLAGICLIFVFYRPFQWGRLSWGTSYFQLNTTSLTDSGNPVVVMLGRSPTSYIVPLFPPNYRFVRPEGNLYLSAKGEVRESAFLKQVKDLLSQTSDNIYILYDKNESDVQPLKSLMALDLKSKIGDCFLLEIDTPDELEFCRLTSVR